MKKILLVLALALLAGLAVLESQADEWVAPDTAEPPPGPWFEVEVVKPRGARPLAGLLPDGMFGLPPSVIRFDRASPGAEAVHVGRDRLELRADGWELLLVLDADGEVAPGTRLVFTLELGPADRTLCCRPADGAGHLRTEAREGSDTLDGEFLVQLAECETAETGAAIAWPPAPLTVRGRFRDLPRSEREHEDG